MSHPPELYKYKWHNSNSIPVEIQIGICRLEMAKYDEFFCNQDLFTDDISISAQIICNNVAAHESPSCTYTAWRDSYRRSFVWDYVMLFPLKVRDLPFDSLVAFTVKNSAGKVIGSTTMRFFDSNGLLKLGKQKLVFYLGKDADTNTISGYNTTPGELYDEYAKSDQQFKTEKLLETFKNSSNSTGDSGSSRSEWLDKLTFTQLQLSLGQNVSQSSNNNKTSNSGNNTGYSIASPASPIAQQGSVKLSNWSDLPGGDARLRSACFLVVELPHYTYPVLYEEYASRSNSSMLTLHDPPTSLSQMAKKVSELDSLDSTVLEFNLGARGLDQRSLVVVADWESDFAIDNNNIFEDMHKKTNQNIIGRGNFDPYTKPNLHEKEMIDRIVKSVKQMQYEDMELLYRFRYTLTENPKALVKFLCVIDWANDSEVAELPTLLTMWKEKAPIDLADALKLLGKGVQFQHIYVRSFAVEVLSSCNDKELLDYLLQLVQALRYEPAQTEHKDDSEDAASAKAESDGELKKESASPTASASGRTSKKLSPLANFLIKRAVQSFTVANFLYWYLRVEISDETSTYSTYFEEIFLTFLSKLSASGEVGASTAKQLEAQSDYILKIMDCMDQAKKEGRRRDDKLLALKKLLPERNLQVVDGKGGIKSISIPLTPEQYVVGLNPEKTFMFSSAIYPAVFDFNLATGADISPASESAGSEGAVMPPPPPLTRKIMFKKGDDLKQDQLIMQMFSLMDSLLKQVNLDLKLLTYKILALSQDMGIMEFVLNSDAVSGINKKYNNDIQAYLREQNPDPNGPYGMTKECMDNWVKSCAGCCVTTYILGIGDRHLDNLMIKENGQLFHIDFGYAFGNDPKPLPPPFRLTNNMIDAMGGQNSEHFSRFKSYCYQAFNWLRKSANLILNLLSLMGDAGIMDIGKRQDIDKVLSVVELRFHLEKTDEEAEHLFATLINEAYSAMAPKLNEAFHKIAVSLR